MKNYLFILGITLIGFSCTKKEPLTPEDIMTNWEFKKETISSFTPGIISLPKTGTIQFNTDNTGLSSSFIGTENYDFDWEFENGVQKITIIKDNWANPEDGTTTYDINRINRNRFILTYKTSWGADDYTEEILTLTRTQ